MTRNILDNGEACNTLLCVYCGFADDPVIRANREGQWREKWRRETDREMKDISREQKIIDQNEEPALKYSF